MLHWCMKVFFCVLKDRLGSVGVIEVIASGHNKLLAAKTCDLQGNETKEIMLKYFQAVFL